jgi:hypothetical protein
MLAWYMGFKLVRAFTQALPAGVAESHCAVKDLWAGTYVRVALSVLGMKLAKVMSSMIDKATIHTCVLYTHMCVTRHHVW